MNNSTNPTLDRLVEIKNEIQELENDFRFCTDALKYLYRSSEPKSIFFGLIKNRKYEDYTACVEWYKTHYIEAPKKINALQAEYDLILATNERT